MRFERFQSPPPFSLSPLRYQLLYLTHVQWAPLVRKFRSPLISLSSFSLPLPPSSATGLRYSLSTSGAHRTGGAQRVGRAFADVECLGERVTGTSNSGVERERKEGALKSPNQQVGPIGHVVPNEWRGRSLTWNASLPNICFLNYG